MKALKTIQWVSIVASAVIFLLAVLTGFGAFPARAFLVKISVLHKIADTGLIFSIALGLYLIVNKKKD
jgi:hypothetical protein